MNIATFRFQTFHPSSYTENPLYILRRCRCKRAFSVFSKTPEPKGTPASKRERHIRCMTVCTCICDALPLLHNVDNIAPPEYSKTANTSRQSLLPTICPPRSCTAAKSPKNISARSPPPSAAARPKTPPIPAIFSFSAWSAPSRRLYLPAFSAFYTATENIRYLHPRLLFKIG